MTIELSRLLSTAAACTFLSACGGEHTVEINDRPQGEEDTILFCRAGAQSGIKVIRKDLPIESMETAIEEFRESGKLVLDVPSGSYVRANTPCPDQNEVFSITSPF